MSINMDDSGPVDYSDFRGQQIVAKNELVSNQDAEPFNAAKSAQFSYEPLAGSGGLANNEVAELVYLEVIANVETDDELLGPQTDATNIEHRGAVGANLSPTVSQLPNDAEDGSGTVDTYQQKNVDEANSESLAQGTSQNNIFQMFSHSVCPPFDDEATGAGGGGSYFTFHAEKPFRSLTGRGPVLDQTDSLDINSKIIVGNGNEVYEGTTKVHAIWDVAEVSDAGREFSLPM